MKTINKLGILMLLSAITLTFSGCGVQSNAENEEEVIKKQVKVQEISRQNEVDADLNVSGTVTPKEYSLIRSLVAGTVEYVIPVGSNVSLGQPLFSIRNSSIESSYFTALQSLEQTRAVTNQRVQQAELGVNSSKASLDLMRSQFDNTIAKADNNLRIAEDSAIVSYDSAYNTLRQTLLYLNKGNNLKDGEYMYRNILTSDSQLRIDTDSLFDIAVVKYLTLEEDATNDNIIYVLNDMQDALLALKNVVDNTSILLETAIPYDSYTAARTLIATYQAQINQYSASIITAINNINNTKIGNRLSIDNAQAQLDLAEINFNNSDISLSSAKEGAQLEMNASQSQLDTLAYNYSNLNLPSPFSGVILSRAVEVGEQVSPGQELIEVGNLSIIEITVDVDVSFADAIKLNDPVTIDDQYFGFVSEIEPVGDLTSGKIKVKVQSEEASNNLKAGSIADVKFKLNYKVDNAIIIPLKSATIENTSAYVFVLEDDKAARRDVTLGQIYGNQVSVLSGLEEGDKLILLNGVFVATGDEVEIVE